MTSIVTVVTPATSQDLTVLATVKEELGITDNALDLKIARWIHEASSEIATYCGRVFGIETIREEFRFPLSVFDGPLMLSRYPVQSVVSVTGDGGLLDVAEFDTDAVNSLLYRINEGFRTTWAGYAWSIVYTAGYNLLGDLPYDLERACLQIIKSYKATQARDSGLREQEIPGVLRQVFWVDTSGKQTSISPEVRMMLDPYRRIVMA